MRLPVAEYETIRVRPEPDVVRITLDRVERQNSIGGALIEELHSALDLAERSRESRVVVLAGAPGVFCTGMDLGEARSDDGSAAEGAAAFLGLLKRLTTIPLAIVAQVDGRVSGGGVGLVAASDFVYATRRSTFSLPEALWGLVPCCVLPFLVRRVGFQPAYAMALSTLPVTAEDARAMHLVDELTDAPDQAVARLRARLVKVDAETIAGLKRYARQVWLLDEEMERLAVAELDRLLASALVRDRISSFVTGQALPWERPST